MSENVRKGLIRAAIGGGLTIALLAGCDDPASPPPGAGDPENISRVTVVLTPTGATGTTQTSSRFDPDGAQLPQPVGPASATLALTKGVTYNGTIELLNDIATPVIDITDEVADEEDFHQFVYTFELTGGGACNGISVPTASMDTDSNGQPVGLTYQVVVTAGATTTTSCNMRVVLRHYDGVPKTSPTFDTDIDITFPVSIS